MSLSLKDRYELTSKLAPLYEKMGKSITVGAVPFRAQLNPEEQAVLKKIIKKLQLGTHTPATLMAEYLGQKPEAPAPQPPQFLKKDHGSKKPHEGKFPKSPKQASPKITEARNEKKQAKAARKRQQNALELALIAALRENREFSDYANVFLAARAKKRKMIAYLGPTNSGKTHAAMESLAKSAKGTYLGPLRLMALENYDRLREKGIAAGLMTGEERIDLDQATHICQTIETADFTSDFDVAVIDEIQLLTDKDRGGYWLNAVMGIAADKIYLCGAPVVEDILRDLAALTGDEIEFVYTERKTPLVFAEHREDPRKLPEPGTAFIAFSRKNVLLWKDMLEGSGAKVSVVYGALSPEVRKEQSRRFREGETDYLVATDAVGMGLNLPIHKVLFTDVEKFDGEGFRRLRPQEVKQIGGRAGRYGISNEAGVISSYVSQDLYFLKQCYHAGEPEVGLTDVHMKPTSAHIRKICESFNDFHLEFALRKFQKIGHEIFAVDISEDELTVAEKLDRIFGAELSTLSNRWFFSIAPSDPKNEDAFHFFLDLAIAYKKVILKERASVELTLYADERASLEFAETQRKCLTLYLWFANKRADVFVDKEKAQELAAFYDQLINKLLSHSSSKKKKRYNGLPLVFCKYCKAMMPPFSAFDVCRDCYNSRR